MRRSATARSAGPEKRIVQAGGRPTDVRKRVLAILLGAKHALSHTEVEEAARAQGAALDRVTLYRVLDWLVARGLAHKIAGGDRLWRFNAAADETRRHAHFHCTGCGQVFCLKEITQDFSRVLPPGFRFQRAELSIEGTCARCARR
jgi:Fur family ferric uptake transcriptional regulator